MSKPFSYNSSLFSLTLFLSFFLIILPTFSIAESQNDYQSYTNERFHFSIDYPTNLLTAEPPPQNGDGRVFSNEEASLTAWGNLFLEDIYPDMAAVFESATENLEVTYQLLEEDFFVASGFTADGKVFYRRSDLLDGVVYNFLIEYPKDKNYIYDSVTTEVANSFTLPIASYDCDLASTDSELLICNMPRLSLYDSRISKSYSYLQNNSPTEFAERLKAQQLEWLERRDFCNTLSGETIFVCHSEEMFSRAEYLHVLEHMQKDFTTQLSFSLGDDISCAEALTMSSDAFIETNAAYATHPYASHLRHWSNCYAQQTFLKHALNTNEIELRSYLKHRQNLLKLMGAYNALRQAQAGGGTMFIMMYADAQQWVETEFAYILDSHKTNTNKIPEKVLKRAGLAPNATHEDKFLALQTATDSLGHKLTYTVDYLLDCCQENLDAYYLEEYAGTIEQATQDIKDTLQAIVRDTAISDRYVAHEVRALADDMFNWFDIR